MVKGGVHGEGGVCVVCTPPTRCSRSMRGRYASYWNAFLLESYDASKCEIKCQLV